MLLHDLCVDRCVLFLICAFAEAKSAADECFELLNSKGDRFGNCGYNIVKCEKRLEYANIG